MCTSMSRFRVGNSMSRNLCRNTRDRQSHAYGAPRIFHKKKLKKIRISSSALHNAARSQDLDGVRTLMNLGSDPNSCVGYGGFTPLHVSAETGHAAGVAAILDAGARVDALSDVTAGRVTPLLLASSGGFAECVDLLLRAGADPNTHDFWGNTPLHKASSSSQGACVQLLLSRGADPDRGNRWGATPLQGAVRCGALGVVRALVSAGCDWYAPGDPTSLPPLLAAASGGHLEILQLLIDCGLDVDKSYAPAVGGAYYSPTHTAATRTALGCAMNDDFCDAREDKVRCVQLLIRAGVNVQRDTSRYLRQKASHNIYFNWDEKVDIFGLVLQARGFPYCPTGDPTLGSIFTRLLDGNQRGLRVLGMLLSVGFTPTPGDAEQFAMDASDGEMAAILSRYSRNPRQLKDICRLNIRSLIAENVVYKAERLPIPSFLRDYIKVAAPLFYTC